MNFLRIDILDGFGPVAVFEDISFNGNKETRLNEGSLRERIKNLSKYGLECEKEKFALSLLRIEMRKKEW
jgi:hypothetical protein